MLFTLEIIQLLSFGLQPKLVILGEQPSLELSIELVVDLEVFGEFDRRLPLRVPVEPLLIQRLVSLLVLQDVRLRLVRKGQVVLQVHVLV